MRAAALMAGALPADPGGRSLTAAIPEFVLAGLLVLGGVLSLRKWLRTRFAAASVGEQILYSLHVTARVGTWFALAGFFVGYAIVDEPQNFGWYVFVIIGLASIQLLSAFFLWRSSGPPDRTGSDPGD